MFLFIPGKESEKVVPPFAEITTNSETFSCSHIPVSIGQPYISVRTV